MGVQDRVAQFSRSLWLIAALFAVLAISFASYVWSEHEVDRTNALRYQSYLLADELRHSSDDLTRMARTYVVTHDPAYRQAYQDILDIREGLRARPDDAQRLYWDLVLVPGYSVPTGAQPKIALLDRMRQLGFPEQEFQKLTTAKASSDQLTALELEAMRLSEDRGPNAADNQAAALAMLHDERYHQTKAAIMQPITEVFLLMERRTQASLDQSMRTATLLRVVFSGFCIGLFGVLARTYMVVLGERQRAQAALHQSLERYHQTLDNMLEGCQIISSEWRYLYLNKSVVRHSRQEQERLIGARMWDAYPGIEQTELFRVLKECMERRIPHRLENQFDYPDGTSAWFDLSIQPVPEGIFILSIDITDRKRAEGLILRNEELLRLFIAHSPAAIAMMDRDLRYIVASERFARDYGVHYESLAGRTHYEIFPEIPERWKEIHQRCLAGAVERADEDPFPRADGHVDWVRWEIRPWYELSGEIGGIILFSEVITERKAIERALQESRARASSIIESAMDAIISTNDQQEIVLINPAAEEMFGYERYEIIGQPLSRLIPERFRGQRGQDMLQVAASRSPNHILGAHGTIVGLRRDGEEFPIEVSVSQTDAEGGMLLIVIVRDITARVQAEREVHRLNNELERRVTERTMQLEAANKELEAFSYSVSHDLRAPLRGIDGWSQALVEDYGTQLDQQAHEYLARVRSETQRMGGLIDDMLRLSRVTRVEMRCESVDLSALARESAVRLCEAEPDRQVDLIIQEQLCVQGDARLLEVALGNMLSNAFKFTAKIAAPRIEVGQVEQSGERVFFVRDNGAGFDMAYAKKLFGAFQRMHRAADFPGTGVGLAIVQRVIQRHGGRVWAESHVDQGAAFYFTLP
jgi:PAS domain S-box-containing protein